MRRGPVKALVWAAGAVAAVAVVPPAQAVTGQQLLQQCQALERGAVVSGETVRLPKGHDAAACWFYMAAVQDFAATVEREGGPSLLGSCVGPDVTRLQLIHAFTRYARAHPEDLDLRATALLIPALSAKFPCPERADEGSAPPGRTRG